MDNSKSWIVLRKSQDFFTLKAKLVEFHGENEICDSPLPSRRYIYEFYMEFLNVIICF